LEQQTNYLNKEVWESNNNAESRQKNNYPETSSQESLARSKPCHPWGACAVDQFCYNCGGVAPTLTL